MADFVQHRWYEKYLYIRQLLESGECLSPEQQISLAHRMTEMINEYQEFFDHPEKVNGNSESPRILEHLTASLHKQRWYDSIPEFHTDLDLLLFLPEEALTEIDLKCKTLLDIMYQ